MTRFFRRWAALPMVLLSIGFVAGCTGDGSSCTSLPGGGRYCLQTTVDVPPFDVQQKVDVVFNGKRETMIAQLEVDASGMRFVGMTPFGQKLLQLDFDNSRVAVEVFPGTRLDPTLLLALVQLGNWPVERVRAGLNVSTAVIDTDGRRSLVENDKEIVVVKYTRGLPPLGDTVIQLPVAAVEFAIVNLDVADNP